MNQPSISLESTVYHISHGCQYIEEQRRWGSCRLQTGHSRLFLAHKHNRRAKFYWCLSYIFTIYMEYTESQYFIFGNGVSVWQRLFVLSCHNDANTEPSPFSWSCSQTQPNVGGHNVRSVTAAYEQYKPADNLIVWEISEMQQLNIIWRTRLCL